MSETDYDEEENEFINALLEEYYDDVFENNTTDDLADNLAIDEPAEILRVAPAEPMAQFLSLRPSEPRGCNDTYDATYYVGDVEPYIKPTYKDIANYGASHELGFLWLFKKSSKSLDKPIYEVIKHKRQGEIIIHRFYKKYGKDAEFRAWSACDPLHILPHLIKNNDLYENITAYPHKVYFDIDGKPAEGKTKIDDYLPEYLHIINKLFKNANIAVSGSITDKKISFHITLSNYLITNDDEREQIKKLSTLLNRARNSDEFDFKVYDKNRAMKFINQSKPQENRPQKIMIGEPRAHFITAFFDAEQLPFPDWRDDFDADDYDAVFSPVRLQLRIQKNRAPFNIGELPRLVFSGAIDFDILDATPAQLLSITPLTDEQPNAYTRKIARYCIKNGVAFADFMAWRIRNKRIRQGDEAPRIYERWARNWEEMQNDGYAVISCDSLRYIILHCYPSLLVDKHFYNFKMLFNLELENIERLEVARLNNDIYTDSQNKFICVNIGMGGGKTAETIKFLKRMTSAGSSYCWSSPSVALAQNTKHRLEAEGVPVLYYGDCKSRYEKEQKLNTSDALLICLNSMSYITSKKFDILIIDEIETFLNKWFNNDTLNNDKVNKTLIWSNFLRIIRDAKKVIFLDAFTSKITMNFINSVEAEAVPLLITRANEESTRQIQFLESYYTWLNDIIQDLKDGRKLFIFYPYKSRIKRGRYDHLPSMEELQKIFIDAIGTAKPINGRIYNGDIGKAETLDLYNVNEAWENVNFIICNTKITVGVNYDNMHNVFDRVYMGIAGFNAPRDILQVSYRARALSSDLIKICFIDKHNKNADYIDDKHYIDCGQNEIYNKLVNNLILERNAPIQQAIIYLCNMAHYNIIDSNNYINETVKKKIQNLIESTEITHKYENIEIINDEQEAEIKEKIYTQEATQYEMLQHKKFYYDLKFKKLDELKQTCDHIQYTESERARLRACLWDNKYFKFIDAVQVITYDRPAGIYKIFKEFESLFDGAIFPTDDHLKSIIKNKTKLNDELLTLIFENFKLKYLTKKSTTHKILRAVYNTTFNKHIITIKVDKSRNVSATVNEDIILTFYDVRAITRRLVKMGADEIAELIEEGRRTYTEAAEKSISKIEPPEEATPDILDTYIIIEDIKKRAELRTKSDEGDTTEEDEDEDIIEIINE